MLRSSIWQLAFSLSLFFAACTSARAMPAMKTSRPLEVIAEDYRNVRGLNYLPVYSKPALGSQVPDQIVATPVAMWRFYDERTAKEVSFQLRTLKRCGINTIRVWFSYAAWLGEGRGKGRHPTKLRKFLGSCREEGLHVIAVLADQVDFCACASLLQDPLGLEPPFHAITSWAASPGQEVLEEYVASTSRHSYEEFLDDVIQVVRDMGGLLLYDVMNEPRIEPGDPARHVAFVEKVLRYLAEAQPDARTTVGAKGWIPWQAEFQQLAANEALHVLSFHPYGIFRANMEQQVHGVTNVPDRESTIVVKPILANEFGFPGDGQTYEAALRHAREVNYRRGDEEVMGVGFCLFSAFIGDSSWVIPFQQQCGLFYADGSVRSIGPCRELVRIASEQGVDETELATNFRVRTDGEGAIDQWPLRSTETQDDLFAMLAGRRPIPDELEAYRRELLLDRVWVMGLSFLDGFAPHGILIDPKDKTLVASLSAFLATPGTSFDDRLHALELYRKVVWRHAAGLVEGFEGSSGKVR